jgi:multidrug efflux pump subunit AcrA (membrane-fusion protein)
MPVRARLSLFAGIASTVLATFGTSCSDRPAQARNKDDAATPKAVMTERVRRQEIQRALGVTGTLAAADQVTISSQSEGVVSRIAVDLGDRIRAGQVMVELDREKLQYNLDQQRAALARALAKYGAAAPGELPPSEQIPEVQKAAAELWRDRQAADRAVELQKKQLIPKQVLEDADATLRASQATYDAALQNARNLRAEIDAAVASVKLAERELRDASITAPFDGLVEKRLVSLGEFVKAQTPVMSIVRVDPLKLVGEIPEVMAPWISVGQTVEIRVDAYPDKVLPGKVSRISPAVNPQTRAFPFEALVANADALLKPGTFARAHLATSRVEPVLTIPYAAMQYRYGVNKAFVVAGGKLQARELKIGDRVGDRVEVLGGLEADDLIAITDVDNLADGQAVSISNNKTE